MNKKRFGLESIGYIAHKYSLITLVTILLITIFMWFGQYRIVFNSNVTDLFKDDSPQYHLFERVNKLFGTGENQLLLTISGDQLTSPENLNKLNNLQLELGFNDNLNSVISPFSWRDHPDENGQLLPIFPSDINAENINDILAKAHAHPFIGEKLLSADGKLILFLLNIKALVSEGDNASEQDQKNRALLFKLRDDLLKIARAEINDDSLNYEISGVEIFKAEIIGYMLYDQLSFTVFGILFGFVISWIYFRRGKFVLLAGLPTVISMITMRGMLGWLEIEMDVLANIAPLLIMVISFCDSVHIVYGIRRRMEQGLKRDDAIKQTIKHIGPACVMTSLTTGIAMVSLLAAQHPIISKFGFICTFGTGFAFVVTLTLIPALAKHVLPETMTLRNVVTEAKPGYKHPLMHRFLDGYTELCKSLFMKWPKQITIFAILSIVVLSGFYLQNEPRYRYIDNLPQDNEAFIGVSKIEEKLSGTNEIRIFMAFDKDYNLRSESSFALYTELENLLLTNKFVKQTLSLNSLRAFVQKNLQDKSVDQFFQFLEDNNQSAANLFDETKGYGLVLGLLPDTDAAALRPELEILKQKLEQINAKYSFVKLHITGILPMSAMSSYNMIKLLNYSLLLAVMGGVFIVAISFRSVYAGLFTLIANLIPIGLAGLYLYIADEGLQFTSVVAFTIGFGIAVDNTIHVIHRYNRAVEDGMNIENALRTTMDSVTSVLVVTSLVLGFGIGIVVISEMPLIKLYGILLMTLVLTALLTDTLLLPSAMRILYNYQLRKQNAKFAKASNKKTNGKLGD